MSLMLSIATQLYIQQIVQAAEELNALHYWPLVRDLVIGASWTKC